MTSVSPRTVPPFDHEGTFTVAGVAYAYRARLEKRDGRTTVYVEDAREMPLSLSEQLAEAALTAVGMRDVVVSWSDRAGCRCGCSPGFMVDRLRGDGVPDLNVWVEPVHSSYPSKEAR